MSMMTTDYSRLFWAAVLLLGYVALCVWIWRSRRRSVMTMGVPAHDCVLLGWASQSGSAEQLAQQLHQQLQAAGHSVLCLPLEHISPEHLQSCRMQLYIVSTYDEGQPPDHARAFLGGLSSRLDLSNAHIQVLGLGDRRYALFCQFARQLQQALLERGAQLAWPLLTVDSLHPQDIAAWHASLAQRFSLAFNGAAATPDEYSATLVERICLNPDSTSPGLFLLRFSVHDARWQAGDTLRLRPFNNPQLAGREYSIASACGDRLELIVRLAGQCSGWLCQTLAAGEQVVFQVCAKPAFYAVPDAPAILIGAGSGLAGLRGHLQARPAGSHNWLIFGERCPHTDRILADEHEQALMNGQLQYLSRAFSRDADTPCYVQDCLRNQQVRLQEWLNNGAVIYLCGSLQGMGRSVESTLEQLLGSQELKRLQQQGRYKTDLY